jgi:hypothetical protein
MSKPLIVLRAVVSIGFFFLLSAASIAFYASTIIPALSPGFPQLSVPRSLTDLKQTIDALRTHHVPPPPLRKLTPQHDDDVHVLALFSMVYILYPPPAPLSPRSKQSFAIPGSALMNILAGALFGISKGLAIVSIVRPAHPHSPPS